MVAEKAGGSIKVNVSSGIKTLMVLKTTQSGFENFHRDEFRALPDANDRSVAQTHGCVGRVKSSDPIPP